MIPDNEFDRLVELGRRKGSLDIDDIKQEMPIDSMTTEDLAGLVILLEEHGISIDLDPELLLPNRGTATILGLQPVVLPAAEAPSIVPVDASDRVLTPGPAAAERHEPVEKERSGFSVDVFVYAMAIGLILFLLAWAGWGYLR